MTLKTSALKGFASILLLLCQFAFSNGVEVKCLTNGTEICEVHEPINGNDESLTVVTTPEQDQSTIVELHLSKLSEVIPSVLFQRFPDIKFASFKPDVKTISQIDFRDAKNLFYLKLDGNHLKVVPKEVFASATKLHTVDLSSNAITDVEDYAFSRATDLNCVMLSKNNLTIIRNYTFAGAPKLTRIELEENQIAVVEEGAFDIPSLEILFFESNRMKQLPDNIFRNAPNLGITYFGTNGMTEIGQAFYNLKSLRSVGFRHSQLKDVDLYAFVKSNPNLENIYLEESGFQFPNIPRKGEDFKNKLRTLLLTNNSISNTNVLEHLEVFKNLEYLDIAYNNIIQIDGIETIKQKFPKFVHLLYPGNPLKCSWVESTQFDRNLWFVPVYHEFNTTGYEQVDGIYCKK
ncbi:leucine-rich repeat-containing G-protein coupled receptor 5-like [Bradysia coprophila]|uniref:leucine-rich repeat-containing G-protein coupled receptor 5-like n=1 Tax=Bradysia coprophila TaxID=38358 RepID=UPI00187D917A|nr:leucine-rich repeat-containing G-protein coupled receptor 5-like [Bradysia coprophila]